MRNARNAQTALKYARAHAVTDETATKVFWVTLAWVASTTLSVAAGRYLPEPFFTIVALVSVFGTIAAVLIIAKLVEDPYWLDDLFVIEEVTPVCYAIPLVPAALFWLAWFARPGAPYLAPTIIIAVPVYIFLRATGVIRLPAPKA